jgi:hypothetical protein
MPVVRCCSYDKVGQATLREEQTPDGVHKGRCKGDESALHN